MNETQDCLGNATREEDWFNVSYFRGGRADLANLPPGAIVWVRIRTNGLKGLFGPWSDPAQIQVL